MLVLVPIGHVDMEGLDKAVSEGGVTCYDDRVLTCVTQTHDESGFFLP